MTHNTIHGDRTVQKAGQAVGAALPLLRIIPFPGGTDRVAGRKATSLKTSTAALASFRLSLSPTSAAPRVTRKGSPIPSF